MRAISEGIEQDAAKATDIRMGKNGLFIAFMCLLFVTEGVEGHHPVLEFCGYAHLFFAAAIVRIIRNAFAYDELPASGVRKDRIELQIASGTFAVGPAKRGKTAVELLVGFFVISVSRFLGKDEQVLSPLQGFDAENDGFQGLSRIAFMNGDRSE